MRKAFVFVCLAILLASCSSTPTPVPAATSIEIFPERLDSTETATASPPLPTTTSVPPTVCSDASLNAAISSAVSKLITNGEGLFKVKAYYQYGDDCVAIIFSDDFPPQRAWFQQGFEEAVRNAWPNWNTAPVYFIIKEGNGYRISSQYPQNSNVLAITIGEQDVNIALEMYKP